MNKLEPGVRAPNGVIPLCVPEIRGREWEYLKDCLDTGWVSSVGPYVDRFEREIANYVGVKHAVATVNGTAALHTALLVAGIEPEDEVLVSNLTFIAPANAIRYVGAYPVFIDAERQYWQLDPQRVADFLNDECSAIDGRLYNKQTGRRVRAILPVHILGHPVDLDPILELAHKYNLCVIEDATEALGAEYKGARVGKAGDIACFSFNGNKLITTGGGGMLVTDNADYAQQAKYLTTQAKDDSLEYIHNHVGYNYRLTNTQAALGCAQLEQLDEYIEIKRRTADYYLETLQSVPGITPMGQAKWAYSTFWMYTILVDAVEYGMDSRALLRHLDRVGIQTRPLWQPMNLSPVYRDTVSSTYPVSRDLNRDALSLPCSVGITTEELAVVTDAISTCARI